MADESRSEKAKEAHDESEQAIQELERQVEQAEAQEGDPVPSQKDANETAATGI